MISCDECRKNIDEEHSKIVITSVKRIHEWCEFNKLEHRYDRKFHLHFCCKDCLTNYMYKTLYNTVFPEKTEHEDEECMCSACCHIKAGEFPNKSVGIIQEYNI
jgi:hypothetical protein